MTGWNIVLVIGAGLLVIFVQVKLRGAYEIGKSLRELRRLGFVDAERRLEREGLVTLAGRAEAEGALVAPFSGSDCIGYAVDIFYAGQEVDNLDVEPPMTSFCEAASFTLVTDAERVRVSAGDAVLLLAPREDPTFVTEDNRARYLPAFERIGLPELRISRPLRVRERLVLPGDRVAVRGEAMRIARQVRLVAAEKQPLLVMRGEPKAVAEDATWSRSPAIERLRAAR